MLLRCGTLNQSFFGFIKPLFLNWDVGQHVWTHPGEEEEEEEEGGGCQDADFQDERHVGRPRQPRRRCRDDGHDTFWWPLKSCGREKERQNILKVWTTNVLKVHYVVFEETFWSLTDSFTPELINKHFCFHDWINWPQRTTQYDTVLFCFLASHSALRSACLFR